MSSSKLSSLPSELVEEILCRVPTESLARLKTTCKQWYALSKDKRFIYKLLDLAKEKQFIQVHHISVQLFKLEPKALLRLPIPDELHDQVVSKTLHCVCDGLLLLSSYSSDHKSIKLAVWNPFLSRVKLIEPSSSYTGFEGYGFGYDNVSRDNYKILRINSPKHIQGKLSEIEIYEFKSKLWRSLEATLECDLDWWKYVSMNGNMYWIANSKMEFFIQSFDFSTETFKRICCVPEKFHHTILSGFGGDRFSLLLQHHWVKMIEVWITNKVTDVIVSWSKFFVFDGPDVPILRFIVMCTSPTCSIYKTNKILLWCECEESDDKHINANVYEMDEGQINKRFVMRRRPFYYYNSSYHVYVPSLVPVPE